MDKKTTEKFILSKNLFMGFIAKNFSAGTILDVNRKEKVMMINGTEYTDLRDFDIAEKLKDKKGVAFIVPYTETSPVVKAILKACKASLEVKQAEAVPKMRVISSDQDLVDDIDITDTCITKQNAQKKVEAKTVKKDAKMEVIRDNDAIQPLGERNIAEMKKRVEEKNKPAKMPIIRDDNMGGIGLGKSRNEKPAVKVGPVKSGTNLRKK